MPLRTPCTALHCHSGAGLPSVSEAVGAQVAGALPTTKRKIVVRTEAGACIGHIARDVVVVPGAFAGADRRAGRADEDAPVAHAALPDGDAVDVLDAGLIVARCLDGPVREASAAAAPGASAARRAPAAAAGATAAARSAHVGRGVRSPLRDVAAAGRQDEGRHPEDREEEERAPHVAVMPRARPCVSFAGAVAEE